MLNNFYYAIWANLFLAPNALGRSQVIPTHNIVSVLDSLGNLQVKTRPEEILMLLSEFLIQRLLVGNFSSSDLNMLLRVNGALNTKTSFMVSLLEHINFGNTLPYVYTALVGRLCFKVGDRYVHFTKNSGRGHYFSKSITNTPPLNTFVIED